VCWSAGGATALSMPELSNRPSSLVEEPWLAWMFSGHCRSAFLASPGLCELFLASKASRTTALLLVGEAWLLASGWRLDHGARSRKHPVHCGWSPQTVGAADRSRSTRSLTSRAMATEPITSPSSSLTMAKVIST
jgi:hypothetical protein